MVRATQPSWAKCQLKPACALYFPAIGILRLDAPHDMSLVWPAGEFVILFMLIGVAPLRALRVPEGGAWRAPSSKTAKTYDLKSIVKELTLRYYYTRTYKTHQVWRCWT